jgi:hypothetical protein
MEMAEIRERTREDVTDLFPQGAGLSGNYDSRRHQLIRDIRSLRRKDLIERYRSEWNCFRAMHARARGGKAVVATELQKFADFLRELGPCPAPGCTIDRTNPLDPEYAAAKVGWATKTQQANNRTNTIMLRGVDGTLRPIAEWARITRQKPDTLRKRHERGWSDIEVILGNRSTRSSFASEERQSGTGKWPPIVTRQAETERAWRALTSLSQYKRLTRDEFFLWFATNRRRACEARLSGRFPDEFGDDADPQYAPAPPLTDDPEYQHHQRLAESIREVQARTPVQPNGTLSSLLRRHRWVESIDDVSEFIVRTKEERSL